LRDALENKKGKLEILEAYWDKVLTVIQGQALKQKDKAMGQICKHIMLVPVNIKTECLFKYLEKCKEMFAIAFFQWRLKHNPYLTHNVDELEELIPERAKRLLITESLNDHTVENSVNSIN
jgi:hypothetical protein